MYAPQEKYLQIKNLIFAQSDILECIIGIRHINRLININVERR